MAHIFQKVSRRGRTGFAVADFPRDLLIRHVESPDLPLGAGSSETIKAGNSALVLRAILPMHGAMVPVACKRVRRKTFLKQMTQAVSRNRTLRTFRVGHRLLAHGIATARPLAVIVPSRFAFTAPTWIVTEWLDGESVAERAQRLNRDPSESQQTLADLSAVSLGTLLGRMHCAGISHRDLKSQNLMLRSEENGETVAAVIDLDGAACSRSAVALRRWKDLARLASDAANWNVLRRSTQMRFVAAYLNAAGIAEHPKAAWRRIEAHVRLRRRRREAA